jgi:chromosome segregation ATPase
MELDQLVKRLDWLDEEHRKDKHALSALEEHLAAADTSLKSLSKQIKEMSGEISRLTTTAARVDQFDGIVTKNRAEINRFIEELEKKREESQLEQDKKFQAQITPVNKALIELRKLKDPISALENDIKVRVDEEARLSRGISEMKGKVEAATRASEEVQHAQSLTEDSRRQDAKRLTDLQGEVGATRKRIEEVREKSDLSSESIRRIETRLTELLASEAERRQAQTAFIEKHSRLQAERERTWKEWEERFSVLPDQTETIAAQLQDLDTVQRAVKRARESYEEMTQKFERRINEISEMQRLSEDRFRQEWVTLKSDQQKNWASYTLSQEEQRRDATSGIEKLIERIAALEDQTQTQQDVLIQTKEVYVQYFHATLAQIHELLTAYDRILGTPKT